MRSNEGRCVVSDRVDVHITGKIRLGQTQRCLATHVLSITTHNQRLAVMRLCCGTPSQARMHEWSIYIQCVDRLPSSQSPPVWGTAPSLYPLLVCTPYHANPASPPPAILNHGGALNDRLLIKLPLATTAQNGSAVNGPLSVCAGPSPVGGW